MDKEALDRFRENILSSRKNEARYIFYSYTNKKEEFDMFIKNPLTVEYAKKESILYGHMLIELEKILGNWDKERKEFKKRLKIKQEEDK